MGFELPCDFIEGSGSAEINAVKLAMYGEIKNCPSMSESYGNIKDTSLAEAIEKPGFKKYWNINKDQIAVCKDCEFRYICTDCRAYTDDPYDLSGEEGTNHSKPLKCGYDPYTGEWSEWSKNPIKKKVFHKYENNLI
ncbi:MAG: SPASM domain peptide maturase of grasp-with-spasm system [Saprospiraceae bacterium]